MAHSPVWLASLLALTLAGCATRSADVAPALADPAEFAGWDCARIEDEIEVVQKRAADLAWAVDEHSSRNIMALGLGVTVFWPAVLAMRPAGPEAEDLARLKGRDAALRAAAGNKGCPPMSTELPVARAAALPVAVGERLVYEDRRPARRAAEAWTLRVTSLRRGEIEYEADAVAGAMHVHDSAGNVTSSPAGWLRWPHLLRQGLELGQVFGGDLLVTGDPQVRARVRCQVVAVGPQTLAARRFDVAVVEVFGDAVTSDGSTRVDGAIVVDRATGVLLRLDLRSAEPVFALQRRLVRVEPVVR